MFDEDSNLFRKPRVKTLHEVSLVPIIDMFTSIIFFILLSASFMQLTKHTLPPSEVSTISSPLRPPPFSPKLLAKWDNETSKLNILITWIGTEPGAKELSLAIQWDEEKKRLIYDPSELQKTFEDIKLITKEEKTLQMGLEAKSPYKYLILLMDEAKTHYPDLVLISSDEASALLQRMGNHEAS